MAKTPTKPTAAPAAAATPAKPAQAAPATPAKAAQTAPKAATKAQAAAPPAQAAPAEPAAPAEGEAAPAEKKVNIDRSRYQKYDTKTAGGRPSVDNGDPLAEALRGMTAEQVIQVLEANGGAAKEGWANLNVGMQRMNAGNALRAILKKNGSVIVGETTVTYVPPAPAEAPAQQAAE